jgi:hypothetical protein
MLTIAGLAAEIGSILILLGRGHDMSLMLWYLALHAVSSVFFSLAIRQVMPRHYQQPRMWVLAYLIAFNFFMPMVGLLCALAAILVGVLWPKIHKPAQFDTASAPEFTAAGKREGTGFRGNRVRAQLSNLNTPMDERLNALVAIQNTPTRSSGEALRRLLADPADDVRLLAYGILDGKEKKITQRIVETREQLDSAERGQQRAVLHKQIAELYQELIYQNLVQGDLLIYSCDQMRDHAQMALLLNPAESGLWFMLVRLELMCGNIPGAKLALRHAQQNGFPRGRLLPYLAELSFLQKDYDRVRALFIEISFNPSVSAAPQLHRYWLGTASAHGSSGAADRPPQ